MTTLIITIAMVFAMATLPVGAQGVWSIVPELPNGQRFGFDCADSLNCMYTASVGLGLKTYIMRTSDGGVTWFETYSEEPNNPERRVPLTVHEIDYATPTVALVALDSGFVLKTENGGDTWREIKVGESHDWLDGPIDIVESGEGLLVLKAVASDHRDQLYRTTDFGETWRHVGTLSDHQEWRDRRIDAVKQFGPGRYLAVLRGVVEATDIGTTHFALTHDSGRSWSEVPFPAPPSQTYRSFAFSFFDSTNGIMTAIVGPGYGNGIVAKTEDGGAHWTVLHQGKIEGTPSGFLSSAFRDSLNGIGGTLQGIVRTTDGGNTWTFDSIDAPPDRVFPSYVEYLSDESAIAVMTQWYVLRQGGLSTATQGSQVSRDDSGSANISTSATSTELDITVLLNEPSFISFLVLSEDGEVVFEEERRYIRSKINVGTIQIEGFAKGVYVVEVNVNGAIMSSKIVLP